MNKKDILDDYLDMQKKHIILSSIGNIKKDIDNKFMHPELDYKDIWYLCGDEIPENKFNESMLEDNWDYILKSENVKVGYYVVTLMYSINTETFGERENAFDETWYEFEAIKLEWLSENEMEYYDELGNMLKNLNEN